MAHPWSLSSLAEAQFGPMRRATSSSPGCHRGHQAPRPGPVQLIAPGATRSWQQASDAATAPGHLPRAAGPRPGAHPGCGPCSPTPVTSARRPSPAATPTGCACWRRWPKTPACTAPALRNGPCTWTSSRPPPLPGGGLASHNRLRPRSTTCLYAALRDRLSYALSHRRMIIRSYRKDHDVAAQEPVHVGQPRVRAGRTMAVHVIFGEVVSWLPGRQAGSGWCG